MKTIGVDGAFLSWFHMSAALGLVVFDLSVTISYLSFVIFFLFSTYFTCTLNHFNLLNVVELPTYNHLSVVI